MPDWPVRKAEPTEIAAIARLWHVGWHDGHAGLMPKELEERRNLEDFEARLPDLIPDTMTAGPVGAPLGFSITRAQELYQLYVAAEARGSGLASRLLAAAEDRIAAAGYPVAELDVAIGNARAERFYQKSGWQTQGSMEVALTTSDGDFIATVMRMTKTLPNTT